MPAFDPWADDVEPAPLRRWSRSEAEALRRAQPSVSPWKVVGVQGVVGAVAALAGGWLAGSAAVGWSVLYGAAVVVLPGALMARGMTSRLSSMSPGSSAVGFMVWEMVKLAVSVAMLVLASRIVQPLSWPALLAGLVLCIKVYWLALLWRSR